MTVLEVDELFKVDESGRYINLILPNDELGPELDLRGKHPLDMNIEETIRIKKYAGMLYDETIEYD